MLTIMFQLPSPITERLYKVNEYWSKLLTHEGPGSLLSSLKKRNWALRIQGGVNLRNATNYERSRPGRRMNCRTEKG